MVPFSSDVTNSVFRETLALADESDLTTVAQLASPWMNKLDGIIGDEIQTMARSYIAA